jgi:hypothetical protein
VSTVNFTSKNNYICLDMFIFIQISMHHFRTDSISDCSNLQSSADFKKWNIFKSSAKSTNSKKKKVLVHKSLIKFLNSRGPKVEPWGTLDSKVKCEEDSP